MNPLSLADMLLEGERKEGDWGPCSQNFHWACYKGHTKSLPLCVYISIWPHCMLTAVSGGLLLLGIFM